MKYDRAEKAGIAAKKVKAAGVFVDHLDGVVNPVYTGRADDDRLLAVSFLIGHAKSEPSRYITPPEYQERVARAILAEWQNIQDELITELEAM